MTRGLARRSRIDSGRRMSRHRPAPTVVSADALSKRYGVVPPLEAVAGGIARVFIPSCASCPSRHPGGPIRAAA